MGRARDQIGAPARSIGGGLFSPLLASMANKLPPNERVVIPTKKQGRPATKDDLTDEQIEACRAAYESGSKTIPQLASEYGVERRRMYAIVNYLTRSARTDVRTPVKAKPQERGVVSADPSINSLACHEAKSHFFA